MTCPADRVSLRLSVGSTKDSVAEVTSSVSKRVEYIVQCLRQNGVVENDISVRKFIKRETFFYHMDAEVVGTFSNFEKMEEVCCLLLDKLDDSICVGTPEFYHSAKSLCQLREQVFVAAVNNAEHKGCKAVGLLGQLQGPPLLVREEETKEWKSEDKECGSRGQDAAALPNFPRIPTATASSRVSISYSIRNY